MEHDLYVFILYEMTFYYLLTFILLRWLKVHSIRYLSFFGEKQNIEGTEEYKQQHEKQKTESTEENEQQRNKKEEMKNKKHF